MATLAAASAFQRAWSNPQGMATRNQYAAQVSLYDYRWHLYQNSVFDDATTWFEYRRRYGLYRYIRPLYNPTRRLVDFYAGVVYPGVLATDAKRLPNGTSLAIPLASDIDPRLSAAIGQLWQWSNWQEGMSLMVMYGAALGDVMVEVVDEVDRGKVTFDIIWPGLVADLELDSTGNVKRYALEYDIEGDDERTYTYRKEVDGDWIVELKDGDPFQYDESVAAVRPNPYGFAPAVWVRHTNIGGNYGLPAVRNVNKIDEMNEIASHAHDRAHAVLSSPMLLSGEGVQALTDAVLESKRVSTQDMSNPTSARESIKMFVSNASGSISAVQLPEGEALNYMAKLLTEIEEDHPELTMYRELRGMSQVTGPAAEIMVGDAASYIQRARTAYDTQTIKKTQMAVAIAGWRANTGAWGGRGRSLTRQQQAFLPFDLESYTAGDLDFEVLPRPLYPIAQADGDPDQNRAMIAAARQLLDEQ